MKVFFVKNNLIKLSKYLAKNNFFEESFYISKLASEGANRPVVFFGFR